MRVDQPLDAGHTGRLATELILIFSEFAPPPPSVEHSSRLVSESCTRSYMCLYTKPHNMHVYFLGSVP